MLLPAVTFLLSSTPLHLLELIQQSNQALELAITAEMAANDVNDILVKLLAAAENVHGPVSPLARLSAKHR